MKKLLLAASIAAASFAVNAKITNSDGFETNGTAYSGDAPDSAAYPFAGFGDKYYAVDEEEAFSANGGTVFDMFVQFTYREEGEIGDGKLGVYANTEGKLVIAGSQTTVTDIVIAKDSWHRLTIAASGTNAFIVYLDGTRIGEYTGAKENNTVTSVSVEGSGKLDNFVARTTNPFYSGEYAASVGTGDDNEKYATYSDALADVLSSGATDAITIAGETPKTVYGTAANPYEITNLADLKALQAAVADGNGADKCYVQTADIALTEAWPGIGVQNGKDLVNYTVGTASGNITQEEADRRDAKWSAGAFKGTYDGGNYTISNFQMVGVAGNPDSTTEGLDYCGFFNSVDGATIKNLKIAYAGSLFATDTTASTKESGATFVGVAKNSTLQNLTSLEGTVSCSKGFGGIVGYTTSGTTVDSCTNNVNMTSLANNKCGGIAMITQGGSGTATIRNCQNNGTTAGKATEKGGIVGYVGVATEIADCEDTAGSDPSFLHHQSGTLTMTGVNKAPAGVKSYTKNATDIDGLNFATVDNGVATFVKSAGLVLGNTYKVMGPGAAYMFEQAGTLTLDQSLATATVTADTSKFVFTTSEPVDNVTTYTAVAGVASVGGQAYATMQDAFDAATDGDTVKLLADIALTKTQTISKSVTLDLNGKNVTATDCRAFHVTAGTVAFTGTGTISTAVTQGTTLASSSSVIRVGSDTAVTSFTLGENVTVTSVYCYGITYFGTKKQTVVINGTVAVTGAQAAISGNGLAKYNTAAGGSDVTVNGTVSATQDYAIYNPQTGTTAITGTVTGGIEVKAGTVTVDGTATVTARNVTPSHSSNQNGTSTQGYAIASVGNSSYKQPAKVSVAAGATVTGTVIILKENGSETYGEITSAVNTLTIPAGYVWNGPADGVYTLAVASGFDGGDGKTFTIDGEVTLPAGKALTDTASAATGLTYAQAAVLGLLDETTGELEKDVTPTISIVNGKVVVSLDGTAVNATRYTVMLNVYKKASLTAEWPTEPTTSYELGSETEAAGFEPASDGAGFYKVGVTIENQNK